MTLTHQLDRTIDISAPPATVFSYFTDSARWAAWWGVGSTIDARPGGRAIIAYPGGNVASGEVIEVTPPSRFVFTYGYNSGTPFGPGQSRVTIELSPAGKGTHVRLSHALADAATRDEHVQGWRYQLSVFANVVADDTHGNVQGVVDAWFDAWADTDPAHRAQQLAAIAVPGVQMRDRFSCIEGAGDLSAHIAASQRFMPGYRLQRSGAPRHCQGTVLADWTASAADGATRAEGTTVFTLAPDGLIESAVGFWK